METAPVWDDEPWEGLPPLGGDVRADVAVVGLGGTGLEALTSLLAAGASVVGVDATTVGGGAAGRNGGLLLAGGAPFHHDAVTRWGRDRAVALHHATLDEIDRIADDVPDAVRRTGSLRIAMSAEEREDCRAQLEAMRADGLPAEPYDGPEGVGLLFPRDAVLRPLRRVRALARRAAAAGAALHEQTPAVGVTAGHVGTAAGEIRCSRVIVAVDGGLERVVPELAGRVRTVRAQMLSTAPTDEVRLTRPVYARWGWDYWQQLPDGRVVLGGCRDHDLGTNGADAVPTPEVQARLDDLLRSVVGVRRAPVERRWAGAIAFTDDRWPVLTEIRPGLVVAGGYSGTGNVVGALAGRAAAMLALGRRDALVDLLAG